MKFKVFLLVLSVLISATYSSDTIEDEEKLDTVDTNKDEEDRSKESVSAEGTVASKPTKHYWVPQTIQHKQLFYTLVTETSVKSTTKGVAELKTNVTPKFEHPPVHDFKFAVSIQRKGAHYATGALIDSHFVLTSAKEFYNIRESIKLFRLRIGTTDCKRGGILVPIKEILIHPSYNYGDVSNDLALLRLATPAEQNENIEPITLSQFKACNKFVTTYWPKVFINNILLPASAPERVKYNHLRVSTQRLMPWKECFKWMATKNITLQESTLCLKPILVRHSKCMPDVGAPVLSSDGLWGVTSGWKSIDCYLKPSPTLVTKVSAPHINSWLKKWTKSPQWNGGATDAL